MKIGVLFVAMFALLFTACPGNSAQTTAQKKSAVQRSYKAFAAFNSLSLLKNGPRLQDVTPLSCTSGSGTADVTGNDTQATIKLVASNCVVGDTTLSTGTSGFTLTASQTVSGDTTTFTLGFNGSLTVKTADGTTMASYGNFSFKIVITGNAYTITVNGSFTDGSDTYTFNNETYTQADLSGS